MAVAEKRKPTRRKAPKAAPPAANPWPAWLKALRNATGKSHQELADSVGVNRRTWRAWLYGENQPSKPAAKLLHILYGEILK